MSGPIRDWQADAGYCWDCGKKMYWSRKHARAAARAIDKTMSAYPCGTFWHVGHLPGAVRVGKESRAHFRRRRAKSAERLAQRWAASDDAPATEAS